MYIIYHHVKVTEGMRTINPISINMWHEIKVFLPLLMDESLIDLITVIKDRTSGCNFHNCVYKRLLPHTCDIGLCKFRTFQIQTLALMWFDIIQSVDSFGFPGKLIIVFNLEVWRKKNQLLLHLFSSQAY